MSSEIIKFGTKYKGQPIEVLANDPNYVEWLIQQAWFKSKYPTQYNIIINNFSAPSDTPEHNRLQAKFLDRVLLERLARQIHDWPHGCVLTVNQPRFEVNGWDVYFGVKGAEFCWLDKSRNSSWTDREYNLKDKTGFVWGEFTGHIDDIFGTKDYQLFFARYCNELEFTTYGVELKSVLGDDFPSVLRQVKRHGKTDFGMVIVDQFKATSVSFSQVADMFMGDRIRLILLADIDTTVFSEVEHVTNAETTV